mgnify:CR=1 FL=1
MRKGQQIEGDVIREIRRPPIDDRPFIQLPLPQLPPPGWPEPKEEYPSVIIIDKRRT